MNRIIICDNNIPVINNTRGAKVYGLPLSPELNSFINDVSPQAQKQRLIAMFFAGNYSCMDAVEDMASDFSEDDLI